MIIEAVMNLIAFVVLGVLGLFPTVPHFNLDYLNGVFRVLSLINQFVDLRVLGLCVVAILIANNARIIWSVVMWVIRKLPFVN